MLRSCRGWTDPELLKCPCCGAGSFRFVAGKAIVTRLVRCRSCQLLFRIPRDPVGFGETFYQRDYASGGLTTRFPDAADLNRLLDKDFRGTDKDFSGKIRVLEFLEIRKGARILDFGASWGYLTWQLRKAGYDAVGYEISEPRAQYARERLGVRIETAKERLDGTFDVVFSSHVLEHLANPQEAFGLARKLLRKDGVFVAFTPNGSEACFRADRVRYNRTWGRLHPLYLDEKFYRYILPNGPKLLTTREYGQWHDLSEIGRWDRATDFFHDLSMPELLAIWVCPGSPGRHAVA